MATIPSVQLFRNSNIISGREAAINALKTKMASVADGGLILARYSDDGTDNGVKTLLGIVRNGGGTNVQITIIDVEGAAKNVQKAIEKAINDLNNPDNAVDGQYVASVSEEKGIITVTRKPLPSFGKTSDSGKAITAITQTNGLVSVEFGEVLAANVSVADKGNKFTATNVEDVLLEIQTSLDNAIGVGGSVGTQITNAINALDSETVSGNGQVITAISQSNGIVSATAATLGADNVSASTITDDGTKVDVTGNNVAAQISSLATSIKTVSAAAKTYSITSISGDELKTLGTNVQEAYKLVDGGGTQAGSTIKIYKDSSLKSVALDGQTLNFTYILADGNESTVGVDVSTFLAESEFDKGLEVVDHVVNVKIDTASETFLTVGADGVKLSGVQAAIDTASGQVNSIIDARLGTGVTSSSTATAQFAELQNKLGNGVTTTATVTAQLQALSGSSTSDTSDTISVIGARKYTDAKIANLNATITGTSDHVDVTVAQANGIITSVTVANKDIASADALADETTKRQNADTALSDRLGTGVTTAEGGTVTAQLQALSGETSDTSGATSVKGAKAYAKDLVDNLDAEVESKIKSETEITTTKAIKIVQTNGIIESITLGAFDCGVY